MGGESGSEMLKTGKKIGDMPLERALKGGWGQQLTSWGGEKCLGSKYRKQETDTSVWEWWLWCLGVAQQKDPAGWVPRWES